MAEVVDQADYGWFSPADLQNVIRAIHGLKDWKHVILVGGQSLTAWVQRYEIELPQFEGPYLTADADFLASKADAEHIARDLHGTAHFPKPDDHTPNTAVIDFKGASGELLHIDILSVVLGLKPRDVERFAVPIGIDDLAPINVLHPLLVLESRCINLERLSEKRHLNGITQARVACLVVQHYLKECLQDPSRHREALNATKRLAALAQSYAGVFVHRKWGVDVLSIVDPSKMPGQFPRSWHFEVARTERKRAIAALRKDA